ncbi:alpha/beta hydrolase [Actinoplanes sp. NPDC051861]|uniref:alpha/beta hydrolase n=1 Tax=Actinoplanes sp. NPDC051861 TaxID=3155170 RepID=UPI003443FB36
MISDIAYAPGNLLDLHLPPVPNGATSPLLVWTGGSAWMADNGKDSAGPFAEAFNPRGYAVAGVSIRSSSQATFPAQLHDIRAAMDWLRSHAGEYRIDPHRLAVMGDSSGGWTAVMAALTCGVPAVAFYPPVDFLRMDEQMLPGTRASFNELLGLTDCHNDPGSPESLLVGYPIQTRPQAVAATNPINHLSDHDPPIMILHGQEDQLVPHGQSVLLYNALRANGSDATFFSVPGAGHDWRQVLDPANHVRHTVHRTQAGTEQVSVGTPAPSWDTIDDFLRQALG